MWSPGRSKLLDKVRVRTMTTAGITDRHAMWATRKNPPDLTGEQRTSLAEIADTNAALYRAYLLKEQLREVFRVKGSTGRQLLAGWLSWASHSRIPEFVALARGIRRYRELILNTLDHHPVQRQIRSHQHPPTGIDQAGLWISQPRRADRHGPAHPRRPLPRPTGPEM
jgi:transposase